MAEFPSMLIIKSDLHPCFGCNASSATSRKEVLFMQRDVLCSIIRLSFSSHVLKLNRRTADALVNAWKLPYPVSLTANFMAVGQGENNRNRRTVHQVEACKFGTLTLSCIPARSASSKILGYSPTLRTMSKRPEILAVIWTTDVGSFAG